MFCHLVHHLVCWQHFDHLRTEIEMKIQMKSCGKNSCENQKNTWSELGRASTTWSLVGRLETTYKLALRPNWQINVYFSHCINVHLFRWIFLPGLPLGLHWATLWSHHQCWADLPQSWGEKNQSMLSNFPHSIQNLLSEIIRSGEVWDDLVHHGIAAWQSWDHLQNRKILWSAAYKQWTMYKLRASYSPNPRGPTQPMQWI